MARRVWYASFGSNLWPERFRVYLEGGVPPGSTGSSPGARDSTLPTASRTMFCRNALNFGGQAASWGGGGVAFLGSEPAGHRTALRMYQITAEQFEDVFFQENGMNGPVDLDFERAAANGHLDAVENRYGRVLHLGEHNDGIDIFTITTSTIPPINPPHHSYIQTIANGLRMDVDGFGFGLSDLAAVRNHLAGAAGMDGFADQHWAEVDRA